MIEAAGLHMQFSVYRTAARAEIDLVIKRGGRVAFAIEFKRSTEPQDRAGFYGGANDSGAVQIRRPPGTHRSSLHEGADAMPLLTALEEVAPGAAE